jgi:hypothetical protein
VPLTVALILVNGLVPELGELVTDQEADVLPGSEVTVSETVLVIPLYFALPDIVFDAISYLTP